MAGLSEKLRSLHDMIVKNADLIPLSRWGFDQNALDIVKSHKHSVVNEKLTFKQKKQMSKKQKQQLARGVGAVPQKVSDVCRLLSNVSVTPKVYNQNKKRADEANETVTELHPEIEAILKKKGVKRRNTTSISKMNIVPEKKSDHGVKKNEKIVPKKEKKVLNDKERGELKERRKQSRLNRKNTQKADKSAVKPEAPSATDKEEAVKENKPKKINAEISFNKLDFVLKDEKTLTKNEKKNKLSGRDFKALQTKLDKRKEYVKKLKEKDPIRAEKFEKDIKWDTVLNRAEGIKVKDNPQLLVKAQKRKDKIKEKRKEKWDERVKKVEDDKKKRQDKRNTNLAKRRDTKVQKKLERARKKGRLV
ncbi:unnamed protein product [Bursaphelenchus xylophilus]|uniref:(pine wood nematode) hypothetical protein n=1 Tax=Bursaphelenchus xylophilus TaxID=6326 RepID=A0A1I7SD78_BURXY|nr:unnamed protein product [Bursaphelenchus xylophilus]CAG9130530.1 unnamed protein product [Bursaphelenchus xylophilus]